MKHFGKQGFQQYSPMKSPTKLLQGNLGKVTKHCRKHWFQLFSAMQSPEQLLLCNLEKSRNIAGNNGFSNFRPCDLQQSCCNATLEEKSRNSAGSQDGPKPQSPGLLGSLGCLLGSLICILGSLGCLLCSLGCLSGRSSLQSRLQSSILYTRLIQYFDVLKS